MSVASETGIWHANSRDMCEEIQAIANTACEVNHKNTLKLSITSIGLRFGI